MSAASSGDELGVDLLVDARKFLDSPVGESNPSVPLVLAILGVGQQLRRIADQMEPADPDVAVRVYLAREGRI